MALRRKVSHGLDLATLLNFRCLASCAWASAKMGCLQLQGMGGRMLPRPPEQLQVPNIRPDGHSSPGTLFALPSHPLSLQVHLKGADVNLRRKAAYRALGLQSAEPYPYPTSVHVELYVPSGWHWLPVWLLFPSS